MNQRSDSVSFNQLTQDQIKRLKDAFLLIDEDGDGSITTEDLRKALKSVGKSATDEELSLMLGQVKSAETEGIKFPEFLTLMGGLTDEFSDDEEIVNCFKDFMTDGTGRVSVDELVKYLKEAGYDNPETRFARVFDVFSSLQKATGETIFRAEQFLNTISDK